MDSTTRFGDYKIIETGDQVAGTRPALVTRFRWRAERRCRRLNAARRVPFYRWEIARERAKVGCVYDDRWVVVAMQNRAEKEEADVRKDV